MDGHRLFPWTFKNRGQRLKEIFRDPRDSIFHTKGMVVWNKLPEEDTIKTTFKILMDKYLHGNDLVGCGPA